MLAPMLVVARQRSDARHGVQFSNASDNNKPAPDSENLLPVSRCL
jgi:hypothetical protein